jgi:DNA-binding NarL/FixJ family response regulator
MGIKVFLADDHAVVRDGLKLILQTQEDMEISGEAADGRLAIKLVKQLSPDVVVMDIAMPGLSGIEATRQILKSRSSTQIVMLSMHASNEHIFQALQSGARGYLLKESAGGEVIQAVRAVHSGRRYFSTQIGEAELEDYISRIDSSARGPLEQLSSREKEVLQLTVDGKSNSEIASILCLSVKTVETYKSRFMHKLDINDIPALVKFALQHGLTTLK